MFFKNLYFSWQYLKKNLLFSLINIIGLVIGITSALFIFIYVSSENSYDSFHEESDSIYRVLGIDSALGVTGNNVGIVMPALGPAMENDIPEVEEVVRISKNGQVVISVNNQSYYTEYMAYTENSFFDVFNFELLQRESTGFLLDEPNSAIMTEAFAQKVFGDEAPLGKVFVFEEHETKVVGVMENNRTDSHMKFDLLVSLNNLLPEGPDAEESRNFLTAWGTIAMVTYAKLESGANELLVEKQLTTILDERSVMETFSATLQPLSEAHLRSSNILFDDYNHTKGDAQRVVMLSSVAVFLLLIAAFNFMNLSTARSSLRAKEVGLRKSSGATRIQLIKQFLQESFLLVFIASVLGLWMLLLLEPVVSLPLQSGFMFYLINHGKDAMTALGALLVLALFAGAYPAFVLSSFSPVMVLKGKFANTGQGLWLRRFLVVLQFALSIAIIIGMLVVSQQLNYMKNKNLGFERDGIVNITLNDYAMEANYEALKNELLKVPEVVSVARSSNMPGSTFNRTGMRPFGGESDEFFVMSALSMDSEYLDTLSMNLVAGRNYSPEFVSDEAESLILNESAVKALGWNVNDAVGKTLLIGPEPSTLIGIVEDFHFVDMRHAIEPVILFYQERDNPVISLRIDKEFPAEALAGIEVAWDLIHPDYPFSYTFFTEEYNKLFDDDEEFSTMIFQFTFIAIIIACLGLYGLASFSADQKAKEIGIRRVLGASSGSILKLVLKEYLFLIAIANLLAWGVAWYVMNQWLSEFAYHTSISILSFTIASIGTAVLALLTVGREVLKVLRTKPADSLRYE